MNQRHRLIRFVGWAMLLAVALGLGWSKAVSIWIRSQSGDNDALSYYLIILLSGVSTVVAAERGMRMRLALAIALGVWTGWLLGPTSSSSRELRISGIYANPTFAFRPTNAVIGAFAFGCAAYFLPELRRTLNTVNERSMFRLRRCSTSKVRQNDEP